MQRVKTGLAPRCFIQEKIFCIIIVNVYNSKPAVSFTPTPLMSTQSVVRNAVFVSMHITTCIIKHTGTLCLLHTSYHVAKMKKSRGKYRKCFLLHVWHTSTLVSSCMSTLPCSLHLFDLTLHDSHLRVTVLVSQFSNIPVWLVRVSSTVEEKENQPL